MTDIEKTASALAPDDVAKVADKLNEIQVRTMTWWSKGDGVIQCDVPKTTQNALVKRGLAEWTSGDDLCAHLTPFGLEVQAYLFAKAEAEQKAKDEALAAKFAAERKIREEGYEAGRLLAQRQNEDKIRDLWNVIQILVCRLPGCETVITEKEMRERSDLGVVSTIEQPDGGVRLKVRQR